MDIVQGYIHNSPEKVVRVRTTEVSGKHRWGFITIKGSTEGMSRDEYEYDIPFDEASEMLNNLCNQVLRKVRFTIDHEGLLWEIDVFKDGIDLVIAEVELDSEDQDVPLPDWVSEEVTYDPKYFNSNIIKGSLK
jgi:adenylate cyclase